MFFKLKTLVVSILAFSVMLVVGCSTKGNMTSPAPVTPYQSPVSLAYPDGQPIELKLVSDLPGMIRLIGDSGCNFVTGTIDVSDRYWAPEAKINGNRASLTQTTKTNLTGTPDLTNLWKLRVSDNRTFRMGLHNARAEGHWNLSGLPISHLYAELGAAKNAFTFDQPNPDIMQTCELHCSTGEVVVEGILNAACRAVVIQAGQGTLTLRFNGKELLETCRVEIQAGSGPVNISLSSDTPARISVNGTHPVTVGDGIIRQVTSGSNDVYETAAYHVSHIESIEIKISGGSAPIYLNPPP